MQPPLVLRKSTPQSCRPHSGWTAGATYARSSAYVRPTLIKALSFTLVLDVESLQRANDIAAYRNTVSYAKLVARSQ